jgi:AraC-like DNA-binding protein
MVTGSATKSEIEDAIDDYAQRCAASRTAARVSELAVFLEIDRHELSGLSRRLFGLSAKAVLRGRLLTEAARLLRETTLSISEIAARIALGERRTFYRAFRQGFDCSPDAFRKD